MVGGFGGKTVIGYQSHPLKKQGEGMGSLKKTHISWPKWQNCGVNLGLLYVAIVLFHFGQFYRLVYLGWRFLSDLFLIFGFL